MRKLGLAVGGDEIGLVVVEVVPVAGSLTEIEVVLETDVLTVLGRERLVGRECVVRTAYEPCLSWESYRPISMDRISG